MTTALSPILISRLEKAATDNGFDQVLEPEGDWLVVASTQCSLRVWLDDSRPAPAGWLHLRSVHAVQQLLQANVVREMSLDHDLGWCADCIREGAHLRKTGHRHCPHMPTGYDLCVWMADSGRWPAVPPAVHSGNLEGGARMLGVIARHWSGESGPQRGPAAADSPPPPPQQQLLLLS